MSLYHYLVRLEKILRSRQNVLQADVIRMGGLEFLT
jgi:hypothetical protein